MNPEHPPLLKLLAALPLLRLPLHFPLTHAAWESDDPWKIWHPFLYESGNDPQQIAAWARLVPMGLTVALGVLLFRWTRRRAGTLPALLTLVCYTDSPTILAHGRLVTNDVPAALGVVLTGFAFSRFLSNPERRAALAAGLALGTALLLKFSLVLLVPFVAALTLLWIRLVPGRGRRYLAGSLIIGGIATLLVLLPYLWMTARYPPARQVWDTYMALFDFAGGPLGRMDAVTAREDFAALVEDRTRDLRVCAHHLTEARLARLKRCPAELTVFVADQPLLRAWGVYLLGMLLTLWRASTGDVTYFLGEVSMSARWSYFPIIYAIKEPLAFHLLSGFALLLALAGRRPQSWCAHSLAIWLRRRGRGERLDRRPASMPSSRPHSRRGRPLPDMRALTHPPVRPALSEEIAPVRRRDARAARRLVPEVKAMEMGLWIQRHRGQIRGALLGAGVLLVLTACAVSPPPDDPGGMPPAQGSSAIPHVPPSARVITRYHEFFDATVVEYRAGTSARLTFLAYYTAHGRTPSGPPDTLHLGCVVHPESGHRGHEEGARLIFRVQGQQVDLGELRFTPDPLADSYWLEAVPRQAVLPLLGAATLEGSCGGVPFQLSAAQWATFQAFVAGAAAEPGR